MDGRLLLECAYLYPRLEDNSNAKWVCQAYLEHAYDLITEDEPTITEKDFYSTLLKMSETYETEAQKHDREFWENDSDNRDAEEKDKSSTYSEKQKEAINKYYHTNQRSPEKRLKHFLYNAL